MTKARLAIAAAWGSVAAIALYALLRGGQVAFTMEPHPATVVFVGRPAYVWRAAIALFGGGLVAFPAFLVARRELAARALAPALVIVTLTLLVQTAVAP